MVNNTFTPLTARQEGRYRYSRRMWQQSDEHNDAVYYCAIQERRNGKWVTLRNWRPMRGWQEVQA